MAMKNIITSISSKPVSGHYLKQIKQNRLVFAQTTNITIFIIFQTTRIKQQLFSKSYQTGINWRHKL